MITITWLSYYFAFTLFLFIMGWYPCCCGKAFISPDPTYTCNACEDTGGVNVACFSITITGIVNKVPPVCSNCAEYDGTYILPPYVSGFTLYPCIRHQWLVLGGTGPCGETTSIRSMWLWLYAETPDNDYDTLRVLYAYYWPAPGDPFYPKSSHVYWSEVFEREGSTGSIPCLEFNGHEIPFEAQQALVCAAENAIIKVTSCDCP